MVYWVTELQCEEGLLISRRLLIWGLEGPIVTWTNWFDRYRPGSPTHHSSTLFGSMCGTLQNFIINCLGRKIQFSVLEIFISHFKLINQFWTLFYWVLKIFNFFKSFQNLRRWILGVKIVRYDWSVSGGFHLNENVGKIFDKFIRKRCDHF